MNRQRARKALILGTLLLLATGAWLGLARESAPHPGAFFVTTPGLHGLAAPAMSTAGSKATPETIPLDFPAPPAAEVALR